MESPIARNVLLRGRPVVRKTIRVYQGSGESTRAKIGQLDLTIVN